MPKPILDCDINGVPIPTQHNINLVEFMLEYNSSYNSSKLPGLLQNGWPTTKDEIKEIIDFVDKENSTHASVTGGNGKGKDLIADYICNNIPNFKTRLQQGDLNLVEEIATQPIKGRQNYSFASKLCAFTSIYACKQDNYFLYDKIVSNILPYFAVQFGVCDNSGRNKGKYIDNNNKLYLLYEKRNKEPSYVQNLTKKYGYKWYYEIMSKLLNNINAQNNSSLTKKQLDDFLWYIFKTQRFTDAANQFLP